MRLMSISLDVHAIEPIIIVKRNDTEKYTTKLIKLLNLRDNIDVSSLTENLATKFNITDQKKELSCLLQILIRRTNELSIKNDLSKIDNYLELLYETNEKKSLGLTNILSLCNSFENVKVLCEKVNVLNTIHRVLKESFADDIQIAIYVCQIFSEIIKYKEYSHYFFEQRMYEIFFKIIPFCIDQYTSLNKDIKDKKKQETCSKNEIHLMKENYKLLIIRQNMLYKYILKNFVFLQNNLSEDDFLKICKEASFLDLLSSLITKNYTDFESELLTLFNKLSYNPSFVNMVSSNFVEKLLKLFDKDCIMLDKGRLFQLLALIYNLSFDSNICKYFIKSGFISKFNHIIDFDQYYLKFCIYYNFSMEQDYLAWFSRTNVLSQLLEDINQDKIFCVGDKIDVGKVLKALLINLTSNPTNCESAVKDNKLFEKFVRKVIASKDALYTKALKNISYNTPDDFKPLVNDMILSLDSLEETNISYYIELLALLGNVGNLGEFTLTIKNQEASRDFEEHEVNTNDSLLDSIIIPFLKLTIPLGENNEDLLLNIIITINALITTKEVGSILADRISLLDVLSEIMKGKQEDDEFVCQIVFAFYLLLFNESLQAQVLSHESVLPIIIDLMNDKNEYIKEICTIMINKVTKIDPDNWGRLIHEEMFLRHNAFWLEMVNDIPTRDIG